MQEALQKMKEEEERLKAEEEAKIKAEEEKERLRLEKLQKEKEKKERKKQKEKVCTVSFPKLFISWSTRTLIKLNERHIKHWGEGHFDVQISSPWT